MVFICEVQSNGSNKFQTISILQILMNVWKDCIRVMSMLVVPTHWEVFHVHV